MNNQIKQLERKLRKLTNKIFKLNNKYNNIKTTYLSTKKIDKNVRKNANILIGIVTGIVLGTSIFSIVNYSSAIAAYIASLTLIGSFAATAIFSSIFVNREKYTELLKNKLKRLDNKINKIQVKINVITDEIIKVKQTQENINLQNNSTSNIITSNSKANIPRNRRITLNEGYDYDYRDDMSPVVDSLEEEKVVFKGIEEPHKVRKRTLK